MSDFLGVSWAPFNKAKDDTTNNLSDAGNDFNKVTSDFGNNLNGNASDLGNNFNKNAAIVDNQVRRTGTDPANEFNSWADTPNGRATLMAAGVAAGGYFLAPAFAGGGAAVESSAALDAGVDASAAASSGYLGVDTALADAGASTGADAVFASESADASYLTSTGYLGADVSSYADAGIGASPIGEAAIAHPAAAAASGSSFWNTVGAGAISTGFNALLGYLKPSTPQPSHVQAPGQTILPGQFAAGPSAPGAGGGSRPSFFSQYGNLILLGGGAVLVFYAAKHKRLF